MGTSDPEKQQLRQQIDRLTGEGLPELAFARLAELWRLDDGPAASGFVVARCERLRDRLNFQSHRLFILRSFTVEPLVPLLRAAAFMARVDLDVTLGDFNTYAQEILNPAGALYERSPDTVVLAVQTRDIAPELWHDFAGLTSDACQAAVERVTQNFRQWIGAFRERSTANLIVHNLELPQFASQGVLDYQSDRGQAAAIRQMNDSLRKIAGEFRGAYLLDYDGLVSRHGRANWHDERKWLTVRLPIAAPRLIDMAREWMRFLHPLTGRIAKALVVDLDNTLWGGIIGEDGMAEIQSGPDYPGAAYQAVQRALLDLRRRGILLAIASKNNPEDALQALETHPGMLLRPAHFAALRINWTEKARNLREIAQELNIGIDALAFLDDNPVERQHIRAELPEVHVIELPADPMRFAQTLRECPVFERLSVSDEDRKRADYYAAERQRTETAKTYTSPEEFYRSLDQEIAVAPVTPMTLARVAQLTQKTNQFNLTTKRYTEQQIEAMAKCPEWRVLSLAVKDRFIDNGLVGVAITRDEGDGCEIDTFLLSCRVIGRTVETAFLAHLVDAARSRGLKKVRGRFVPTKKNAPCKDFYPEHGFEQNGDGTLWTLNLATRNVEKPGWIRVHA